MVSLTITDEESDTPFSMSLSGTDVQKFNIVPQNSNTSSVQLTVPSDFAVELIHIQHQFLTNLVKHHNMKEKLQFVPDPNLGTLTTNGTFYIIESNKQIPCKLKQTQMVELVHKVI